MPALLENFEFHFAFNKNEKSLYPLVKRYQNIFVVLIIYLNGKQYRYLPSCKNTRNVLIIPLATESINFLFVLAQFH